MKKKKKKKTQNSKLYLNHYNIHYMVSKLTKLNYTTGVYSKTFKQSI